MQAHQTYYMIYNFSYINATYKCIKFLKTGHLIYSESCFCDDIFGCVFLVKMSSFQDAYFAFVSEYLDNLNSQAFSMILSDQDMEFTLSLQKHYLSRIMK